MKDVPGKSLHITFAVQVIPYPSVLPLALHLSPGSHFPGQINGEFLLGIPPTFL